MNEPTYAKTLHRLALLTAIATFPLIFMGGLVTSKGAGLSVPDWPNSYGYNMFLFPPSKWVGGIFFEHVHRLMGTVVGFCSLVLAIQAWGPARRDVWRQRFALMTVTLLSASFVVAIALKAVRLAGIYSRYLEVAAPQAVVLFVSLGLVCGIAGFSRTPAPRYLRWICAAVLGAVIFQGILGGLRVVLIKLNLAMIHACVAQAFFCFAAFVAVITSRWWADAPDRSDSRDGAAGRRLTLLAGLCVLAVYGQLIIAATMRHSGAGLAIPDLPLAYGKLLPPTAADLPAINELRVWKLHLEPVTLAQVGLHYAHRIGAIVVSIAVLAVAGVACGKFRADKALTRPAAILVVLLVAQLTLGVLTVYYRKPADVASAHVAVGALVLVTSFVLTLRCVRLYLPRTRTVPAGANERLVLQPATA